MNETDKETLKRVYQDQLRDLHPQADAAWQAQLDADRELRAAQVAYNKAVQTSGHLLGQIEAVKALAAAEGITLD